jgi:hypothetical protein
MSNNFISTNLIDAYIVSFNFDSSDYESLTNTWNNIINNKLLQPGEKLDNNQFIPVTNLDGIPINKLSSENDAIWLFLAQTFATPFSFSAIRICNVSMEPSYDSDGSIINSIAVNFTLVDIPKTNDSLLNDKLTSVCLGEWITSTLSSVSNSSFVTALKSLQYAPRSIFKNLRCAGSYSPTEITDDFINKLFNLNTPSAPSSSTQINPNNTKKPMKLNTNNVSEKFTSLLNGSITNVYGSNLYLVEPIRNVGGKTVKTTPSTIFDFLFMYAFPFAFIGSIFYSIATIINIDITSVIANRNISVALNAYVGICGAVSIFVWFNINNPVLGITSLNPGVVKTNNSY